MRAILLLSTGISWSLCAAQAELQNHGLYLGVGLGQDVGGIIGARLSYWPTPFAGAFIGGGWALVGAGYNVGGELRSPSKGRVSPFLTFMYGYNAVIRVENKEELNGIYYGTTAGGGIMVRQADDRNYWRFSINLPFRSDDFQRDYDAIKARPDIKIQQDVLPVTVGIGYHVSL